MKLKYIFSSMVIAVTAMCGFTSCSDDDNDDLALVGGNEELVLTPDIRVKIGAENRLALPVESGNGDYRAFSLNPEIADVIEEGGQYFIEGIKNGTTRIVISDGANQYKQLVVSIYTTENMTLSHDTYTFVSPLGISSTSSECYVDLGNGGYSIESDNDKVSVSITPEDGVITMTATSAKDEYAATVTVTDCTGLTASVAVTVTPTFDGFTANDLENLKNATANDYYISSNKFSYTTNFRLAYIGESLYTWVDNDNSDGMHEFGIWRGSGDYLSLSGNYGGHMLIYPPTAAIDQEVEGKYLFRYNSGSYYPTYELNGSVKVIRDDDTSKVVVWWDVDMENECINRGWIVKMK